MPDSKTKIRPQQSCLKCRERKVKCDRSIPCHACIIRGLEAECSYTATAEDRAHISQADIIDRLRREVAQLRGRLNQPREQSSTKSWRQHPYAPASASSSSRGGKGNDGQYLTGAEREGSWRGSSPSSSTTTMTNSVNVTSPDSTGSPGDNGARSASSRSVSASAPAVSPVSACPVATGYAPQVAEVDGSSNEAVAFGHDATISGYADMPFTSDLSNTVPVQVPVHELNSDAMLGMHTIYGTMPPDDGKPLPYYPQNTNYPPIPTSTQFDELPISNEDHQWAGAYGNLSQGHQFPLQPYPSQYSSNTFANTNANINPYADVPVSTPTAGDTSSRASSNSDRLSPSIMNSIPNSWRGEGKKAVLQALLETIGSCDEHQVGQVIQVVRTSPTPEEAVSRICQVLGIGNGW